MAGPWRVDSNLLPALEELVTGLEAEEAEAEECPVCLARVEAGPAYKDHLLRCVAANTPRVTSNQEVLLRCRGSLRTDDTDFAVKEENKGVIIKEEEDCINNLVDTKDFIIKTDETIKKEVEEVFTVKEELEMCNDFTTTETRVEEEEAEDAATMSEEEEHVDARRLYRASSSQLNQTKYFDFLDTSPFPVQLVRSVEIMEMSCFKKFNAPPIGRRKYYCRNCDKIFSVREQFAGHLYAHTFVRREQSLEPVICSGCGEEFPEKSSWQQHKDHTECLGLAKTIFGCLLCKKIFTRKDNLRDHLKAHAGYRAKRKTSQNCSTCGAKFGSESMLAIHRKRHSAVSTDMSVKN